MCVWSGMRNFRLWSEVRLFKSARWGKSAIIFSTYEEILLLDPLAEDTVPKSPVEPKPQRFTKRWTRHHFNILPYSWFLVSDYLLAMTLAPVWLLTGTPEQRYRQNGESANIGLASSVWSLLVQVPLQSSFLCSNPNLRSNFTQSVSLVVCDLI